MAPQQQVQQKLDIARSALQVILQASEWAAKTTAKPEGLNPEEVAELCKRTLQETE